MLYSNREKRRTEILNISNVFRAKGYVKTAEWIGGLSNCLAKDKFPADKLFEEYFDTFAVFTREFRDKFTTGQVFRVNSCNEINALIADVIKRVGFVNFNQTIGAIDSILGDLIAGKKKISEIAEILEKQKDKKSKLSFHLLCYAYLIMVEGIFDELTRILFFLKESSSGDPATMKKLEIAEIYRKMNQKPVFLNNWTEKKHIRNAIAHAKAFYEVGERVRFIDDKNPNDPYDSTMPWQRFIEIYSELEDSVNAFILNLFLLRLFDLLFAKELPW